MAGKEKVVVAMSGGVDSALASALLLKNGFEVIGAYFQLWKSKENDEASSSSEQWAKRNAEKLGLKFYSLDLKERFRKEIVEPFIEQYLIGKTPNPCALCNPKIKFQALWELADELSAKYIASGHYARVFFEPCSGSYALWEAKDKTKDQSYFLFLLNQKFLSRLLFPLGEWTKKEVKAQAREWEIPSAERCESQDVCFVFSGNYPKLIEALKSEAKKPGEIVDSTGKVLGTHQGIYHYTIGQHRGLGLNQPGLYVLEIDPNQSQIIVGKEPELYHQRLLANGINWIAEVQFPLSCFAKIRYKTEKAECQVEPARENQVLVSFREKQRAITPGQAVVFYREERVLGGGWIEKAFD